MSQAESLYVRIARLAYGLSQASLPRYSHPKSPKTYTQPQLAACVLMMTYCRLSYRAFEEWLLASDALQSVLDLRQVPDHSTLCRMFAKLSERRLKQMLARLLEILKPQETVIAGDSTAFRLTNASLYYQTRTGQPARDWFQGAFAVGAESQLILAVEQGHGGTLNDSRFLRRLRNTAKQYAVGSWVFLADAGFDCKAVGSRDLIPPIRRGRNLVAPERKARADLVAQARLDGLYGKRWIVEMVHSVIKRKFGDTIRSRIFKRQCAEPALKALVYNLYRLPA
jgi:hypothetical protein